MKLSNRTILLFVFCTILGTGFYSIAGAQEPEKSPLEQVEAVVYLNETGLISITYAEPWFWEVGYYARSLWNFMEESLDRANNDCKNLSDALSGNPQQLLSVRSRAILDSQLEDGRIKDIRMLSSLLKKYSQKNAIDAETATDQGQYIPIRGDTCSDLDPNNPGYLQQMFIRPENNPEPYFTAKCDVIKKTVSCLNELSVIDNVNRLRLGDGEFTYLGFSENTFSVVSGGLESDSD